MGKYTHACKKDHITHIKSPVVHDPCEFSGLWKHVNNPACTEGVSLHNVKVEHCIKKNKKALALEDLND